jgi:hypothetical protein
VGQARGLRRPLGPPARPAHRRQNKVAAGWLVSFTPVVNAEDPDEIGWFEAEKDTPLPHAQAQFAGTVFDLSDFTSPWPVAAKRTMAA